MKLNITKVKYTINFQMYFLVKSKTQIVSNTRQYKKIIKKILMKSNDPYMFMYQKLSYATLLWKNEFTKKIEHQLRKNRFGEQFYHYTTAVPI